MSDQICCPKCGSNSIHVQKRDPSTDSFWRTSYGHRKIEIICLNCGHDFAPGEQLKIKKPNSIRHNDPDERYVGPEQRKLYKCSSCGKESLLGSDKICPACGCRIKKEDEIDVVKSNSGCSVVSILVLVSIICAIIIVIRFVWYV